MPNVNKSKITITIITKEKDQKDKIAKKNQRKLLNIRMIRIDGVVRILSNSCRALSSSHKLYFPRKNSLVTESQERWKKYVETIPGMYNLFCIYFLAAELKQFHF